MNNFKKIFISIKSQIDAIADDFENHEALANAAINDLQQLAVTTRQHQFRITNLAKQYQQQLNELEQQATLWSERALKVRDDDQHKAMECMKRLRAVKQQITQISKQYQVAETQAATIENDLQAIQEQLLQLKTKKEELAARQNRSHLQKTMRGTTASSIDVQGVFDRWEGTVVGDEYQSSQELDTLSHTFEQQDDELELQLMLEELTASKKSNTDTKGE